MLTASRSTGLRKRGLLIKRRRLLPGHVRQHADAAALRFLRSRTAAGAPGWRSGRSCPRRSRRSRAARPRRARAWNSGGSRRGSARNAWKRSLTMRRALRAHARPRGSGGRGARAGSASAPGCSSRIARAEGDERRRARARLRAMRARALGCCARSCRIRSVTSVSIIRRTVSWTRRRPASRGMRLQHRFHVAREDRDTRRAARASSRPGAQAVVDVVVVVGDLVGEVGELRLERGLPPPEEALADVAQLRARCAASSA